jgi:NAD(P)-dependent dehydrogenase (short-subunit alcohol dehydrogenase family)
MLSEMKLAVVTGIARCTGIGHAICDILLDKGISVIGLDVNPLDASSPLPRKYADRFRSRICRVDSDFVALNQSIKSALNELGHSNIDVVVNNAGMSSAYMPDIKIDGSDIEKALLRVNSRLQQFDTYIQNNLRSAFLVTEVCKQYFPPPDQGVIPSLRRPSASIIHISSSRALASEFGPSHSQEGYASAKAGLIGLTHAQGQSMAGLARVNVILPGWINTEAEDGYIPTKEDHEWHASGRVGVPNDVAELVAFLADDEKSGFITCQEFVIDGGVTKRMHYP